MLPAHTNILQVTPDPPGGLTARVVAIHHDRDTATGEQLRPLALPGVIAGHRDRGQAARAGADHVRWPLDQQSRS